MTSLNVRRWTKYVVLATVLAAAFVLPACVSTSTPSNTDDLCQIFDEKRSWYRSATRSERKWGISIPIMMAVIYKESSFRATVRPPRKKILGFIPGKRLSTSFGYSQAKEETWSDYIRDTKNRTASRSNFADSIDFVGWYLSRAVEHLGVAATDTEALYASYHVGLSGYQSGSWRNSPSIRNSVATFQRQVQRYERQLRTCTVRNRRGRR
ncbi:MAG: hypothetical protein OXG15_16195 [Gammaproteobacteria bacterium]|nr:hypothetical protein [Gammaproteobacteria bacterium]